MSKPQIQITTDTQHNVPALEKPYTLAQMKEVFFQLKITYPYITWAQHRKDKNHIELTLRPPNFHNGQIYCIFKATGEYLQFYCGDPTNVNLDVVNQCGEWRYPKFHRDRSLLDHLGNAFNAVYNTFFGEAS